MVYLGFYLLPLVMTGSLLIMTFYVSEATREAKKKTTFVFLVWVVVWVIYLNLLPLSGLLDDFGMPPRVPLLIIIPAIAFIFLFVTRSYAQQIVHTTPKTFPVYVQSFRIIVELLIYGAYLQGTFPKAVTFEGTNFDILAGITAPVVAFLYQKNMIPAKSLLVWNITALGVLAVTAYSFISAFYFDGPGPDPWSRRGEFVQMPYLLLAGMLLPFAILYHVVSIRQILANRE